eukprot:2124713-Rhodomonas_salina.1
MGMLLPALTPAASPLAVRRMLRPPKYYPMCLRVSDMCLRVSDVRALSYTIVTTIGYMTGTESRVCAHCAIRAGVPPLHASPSPLLPSPA